MKRHVLVAASVAAVFALLAGPLWAGGGSEKKKDPAPAGSIASEAVPEAGTPARTAPVQARSWAGTIPAPEFPSGMEWLNVDVPPTLASLKGKVALLDFWTYGCINCIHNLPYIEKLRKEFPDELVVLGVHSAKFATEGKTENLRNIILRYGIGYPVVNDADFAVWSIWGPQGWPTLALIDPAGNIVGARSGEGFYDTFREIIVSLIAEFRARGQIDPRPLEVKLEREGRPSPLLSFPGKVRADSPGDRLFIADSGRDRVILARPADGEILDIIGGGPGFSDGDFREARFRNPQGMALSPDGGTLYVADTGNHAIRAVDLRRKRVGTIAGTGTQAEEYPPEPGTGVRTALSSPWDLESDGPFLYIAMAGSHQIWRMDTRSGELKPLAGSGAEGVLDAPGAEAELAQPSGLSLSPDRRLYFADSEASSIRWVDLSREDAPVFTLAGSGVGLFEFGADDGRGRDARFQHPLGVLWRRDGIFVADTYNHRIRRIDPATAEVSTIAGGDGGYRDGAEARFNEPGGITQAGEKLVVADTNNHSIRVVDPVSGKTSTLVLKGYEKFARRQFGGTAPAVRLPSAAADPGPAEIRIHLQLPRGYKPNVEAASAFSLKVEGSGIRLTGPTELVLPGPTFPLRFSADFSPGEGVLVLELSLVYCEEGKESLCYLERKTLELPYRIATGAGRNLDFRYTVLP